MSQAGAWLVYSNCQAQGLANCLRLLGGLRVEVVDQFSTPADRGALLARAGEFERIVLEPSFTGDLPPPIDEARVIRLPTLGFHGYHPDFTLMRSSGAQFPGPIGSSHSMLAYCAFIAGLRIPRARKLFRDEVFEACGYHQVWRAGRLELERTFTMFGFDIAPAFVRWSRQGPFMYSLIHPRIACLADIARMVLERAGVTPRPFRTLPPDNLATGEVLPVYPGIAVHLGVEGSELFKPGGSSEVIDLDEFLLRSYRLYRGSAQVAGAHAHKLFTARMERVMAAVEAFR